MRKEERRKEEWRNLFLPQLLSHEWRNLTDHTSPQYGYSIPIMKVKIGVGVGISPLSKILAVKGIFSIFKPLHT